MEPGEFMYQKAQALTKWSYLGIISPIIGWTLVGVSRSILRELKPRTTREVEDLTRVQKLNKWSMFVSVWWLWLGIVSVIIRILLTIIVGKR